MEEDFESLEEYSRHLRNKILVDQVRLHQQRLSELKGDNKKKVKPDSKEADKKENYSFLVQTPKQIEFAHRESDQLKILLEKMDKLLKKKISEFELQKGQQAFKDKELEQQRVLFAKTQDHIRKQFSAETKEFLDFANQELKTPLVPVLSYLDMLLQGRIGDLNEKQTKNLTLIRQNVMNCIENTSKAFDYQKLIYEPHIEKKLENVNDVIQEAINEVISKANENGVSVSFKPQPDEIPLLCNSKKLSQAIGNIIENRIDSCKENQGKVDIFASSNENAVEITVRDNGAELPKDKLEFFSELPNDDSTINKDGISIVISKLIIQKHGGKLLVNSKENKGTIVRLVLPQRKKRLQF